MLGRQSEVQEMEMRLKKEIFHSRNIVDFGEPGDTGGFAFPSAGQPTPQPPICHDLRGRVQFLELRFELLLFSYELVDD